MKLTNSILSFLIIVSFFLASCATMSDVLKSKNEGTSQVYAINVDLAWETAMTVLRWESCETIEEHRSSGYMLTTVGQDFVSAGSLVGVWIESIDKENTKVTIVTKRKLQTNLATGLTESKFHLRFNQAVDIIKSGKTLPIDAPL